MRVLDISPGRHVTAVCQGAPTRHRGGPGEERAGTGQTDGLDVGELSEGDPRSQLQDGDIILQSPAVVGRVLFDSGHTNCEGSRLELFIQ